MAMAGTVAVPPTFPELGVLAVHPAAGSQDQAGFADCGAFEVVQHLSPKLKMTRTFLASDVMVVFIPDNPDSVDLNKGKWLVGSEILKIQDASTNGEPVVGIAYVREHASALLNVEIGMTAAESAEYYPPLPDDRSVNHYRFNKPGLVKAAASIFDCVDGGPCDD